MDSPILLSASKKVRKGFYQFNNRLLRSNNKPSANSKELQGLLQKIQNNSDKKNQKPQDNQDYEDTSLSICPDDTILESELPAQLLK